MECYICLNIIKSRNKKTLVCDHSFCKKCIDRWELKSNACPCCRAKIQKKLCTMCKYGCIECQPILETIMNDIEDHMRNRHVNALRESLHLLEVCRNL